MVKFKKNDWILDANVFNTKGQEIINRWRDGDGSWLDLVDSDYEQEPYFLDFGIIKNQEDVLKRSFNRIITGNEDRVDYISSVVLLDSLYSTQLKNPVRMGNKIFDFMNECNKALEVAGFEDVVHNEEAISFVDSIATIYKNDGNGTYAYSFATKFCIFLNNNFPEFDSYVAGLIYKHDNDDGKIKLSDLGSYRYFVNR